MVRFLFFELLGVFEVFATDAASDGTIFEVGQTPIPSRPGIREAARGNPSLRLSV